MNKNGTARDVILIVVVMFSLAFALFVLNFFANTAIDNMISTDVINESSETVEALESTQDLTERFDYIGFAVFMGLTLALLITGWLVGGHPIFMIIYFIMVIIGVAISAVFANVWETISQASVFGATIANFPILNHLLSYFPIYISVIGVAGLIVMFAKPYIVQE